MKRKSTSNIFNKGIRYGIIALIIVCVTVLYQLVAPRHWGTSKPIDITIKKGWTAHHVANDLKQQKLIRSKRLFILGFKVTKKEKQLRAGRYTLDTNLSLIETINTLLKPPKNPLIRVTIPEGYCVTEIGALLEKKGLSNADRFVTFAKTGKPYFETDITFLDMIPTDNLEGYLFPDTYFFSEGTSIKTIIKTMLKTFENKMVPIWTKSKKKKNYDFHRMITLASLVERESAVSHERPIIAAVFFNRLRKYMLLASDPTVTYALGNPRKKRVTFKDLRIDSPYNTYKTPGLPPTPIASPGVASFDAITSPASVDYLFFVANRDGTHTFSHTYKEHYKKQMEIENRFRTK